MRKHYALTDVMLKNATKPGKYADGGGLYCELREGGGKYWRLKFYHLGKPHYMTFGPYPAISIKEARDRAQAARASLASGINPNTAKQSAAAKARADAANTFEAVMLAWLDHKSTAWAPRTRHKTEAALRTYIVPSLGHLPLVDITPRAMMLTVKKIEKAGHTETCRRVLVDVKSIFRWALVNQLIESNPMVDLVTDEVFKARTVRHRPAIATAELPAFLRALDDYPGDPVTAAALSFLILTGVRSQEVRGALWSEIDIEQALWIIPAERMKMKSEHRVPLSRQALAVLERVKPLTGQRDLVFASPNKPTHPLSENTLNLAVKRLGYDATAHGMRAVFSTVCNEAGHDPVVIERALAHQERNKVTAAYARTTHLGRRAPLMQWWADALEALRSGKPMPPATPPDDDTKPPKATVIPMRRRA